MGTRSPQARLLSAACPRWDDLSQTPEESQAPPVRARGGGAGTRRAPGRGRTQDRILLHHPPSATQIESHVRPDTPLQPGLSLADRVPRLSPTKGTSRWVFWAGGREGLCRVAQAPGVPHKAVRSSRPGLGWEWPVRAADQGWGGSGRCGGRSWSFTPRPADGQTRRRGASLTSQVLELK